VPNPLPKTAWKRSGTPATPPDPSPAKDTLAKIRDKNPPTFKTSPAQETWAQRHDREEMEVEQKEVEAILEARKAQLKAIEDETMIRKINRNIALRFGGVGVSLLSTMSKAAKNLDERVTAEGHKMSTKELRETIQVLGGAIQRSQSAMEAAAKTERYMTRHTLELGDQEGDDLDDLSPESAKLLLNNLAKSLGHLTKKSREIDVEILPDEVKAAAE